MQTQPATSLAANNASKAHRNNNHETILTVMRKLKNQEAISDTVATYCNLDKVEVSRRFSELARLGKIVDTGRKGITAKGCRAAIYKVTDQPQPKIQSELF